MFKKANNTLLGAALLFAAVILVYAQTLRHDFISFDDTVYVTENPYVRAGLTWPGTFWAFTRFHDSNWFPLTWLSHMLDYQLFGLQPGAHHFMNVLFHAANTLLLFLWLKRMTSEPRKALFVAALFALHPLHVESVAWASERKDVLSGFFWMLTLCAYASYAKKQDLGRYFLVLFAYLGGILSKPMMVTLPFVLLLLDVWPLQRMSRAALPGLVREKIPFFIFSAVSCAVTFWAQSSGGSVMKAISLTARFENAALSYIRYLRKTFWPADLGIFYPYDADTLSPVYAVGCFFLILGVSLLVVARLKKEPWFAVGWFWYLGTLVPVIGLVQVGAQAMADRYTYLPLTGIFIILAWGLPVLFNRFRAFIFPAAISAILLLSVLCAKQVSFWKDSRSIYEHTLKVTKNNYSALQNLSGVHAANGNHEKAEYYLTEALRIAPADPDAMNNLANVYRSQGRLREAMALYEKILEKNPSHVKALVNAGVLFSDAGAFDDARAYLKEAIRLDPRDKMGFKAAGRTAMKQGDWQAAADFFEAARSLDSRDRDVNLVLGNLKAQFGDWAAAEVYYRQAAEWYRGDSEILNNLGNTLAIQGKLSEALSVFQEALRADPNNANLNLNYGLALAKTGDFEQAAFYYRTTLGLDPSNQKAAEKLRELDSLY